MEYSDIQKGLEEFVDRYNSETYLGTFRETDRTSLLGDKKGLATRANTIWKMAEYVVAKYKESDAGIEEYLAGWRVVAKGYSNQYLLIEVEKNTWQMYDSNGVFMGDEEFIINYFKNHKKASIYSIKDSLQQIFYGAPGTGKSHCVKCETKEWEKKGRVVRTTFHPDSDYSTFVGAYKPTMEYMPLRNNLGQIIGKDGKYLAAGQQYEIEEVVTERKITYDFVPQAFLQAYIDAWKNREEPEYLIIEEINRGNCAQIFGDLFQLLDRDNNGYSEYAVRADKDLQKHLSKAFGDIEIDDYPKVKTGEELILPKNLYLRATMNTSDQSLFPIDSAFKRRWDWQYMPIGKGYDNNGIEYRWYIEIAGKKYSWWSFLEKINAQIAEATQSEDKKLGFFFCKAEDNRISAEKFVGKVIFYLWNDVFKDYGFEREIFKDIDGTELSFARFYEADKNGNAIIQEDKVEVFLKNLGVELFEDNTDEDINIPEDDVDPNSIDYTKFSFDGSSNLSKKALGEAIVIKYLAQNQDLPFDRISEIFDFASMVDKQHQYKGVVAKSSDIKGSYLPCYGEERLSNDNVPFKILTWWNKYNIDYIINFAKQQGWEVTKMSK